MKTRMKRLAVAMAATGVIGASSAIADFDGSDALICSLGQVMECTAGAGCVAVTNAAIDAPDFVKFDFRRSEIVSVSGGEDSEPGAIETVQNLGNFLVVQGTQGSGQGNSLGWSVSIDQTTGTLAAAGSGENAVFVIFGACTTQ